MNRQPGITDFEVVRVLDEATLLSAESYQCRYEIGQGAVLQPGFYVVVWPPRATRHEYDDEARFFGPFGSRAEALSVLKRSLEDCFAPLNETIH